eukprot:c23613_g1_i1.p1 GENE.c23613_g1_i1~~c23613_g1_i1.p1  ORF type:complete len:349 (-),score=89.04 c23613_g1_i1:18-1034(-)
MCCSIMHTLDIPTVIHRSIHSTSPSVQLSSCELASCFLSWLALSNTSFSSSTPFATITPELKTCAHSSTAAGDGWNTTAKCEESIMCEIWQSCVRHPSYEVVRRCGLQVFADLLRGFRKVDPAVYKCTNNIKKGMPLVGDLIACCKTLIAPCQALVVQQILDGECDSSVRCAMVDVASESILAIVYLIRVQFHMLSGPATATATPVNGDHCNKDTDDDVTGMIWHDIASCCVNAFDPFELLRCCALRDIDRPVRERACKALVHISQQIPTAIQALQDNFVVNIVLAQQQQLSGWFTHWGHWLSVNNMKKLVTQNLPHVVFDPDKDVLFETNRTLKDCV